jgi:hypothetical protein
MNASTSPQDLRDRIVLGVKTITATMLEKLSIQ